jgi:hypothetical protein
MEYANELFSVYLPFSMLRECLRDCSSHKSKGPTKVVGTPPVHRSIKKFNGQFVYDYKKTDHMNKVRGYGCNYAMVVNGREGSC